MRIREVLIRWYKSFNYDYELKANVKSVPVSWQETSEGWLPHVRIGLEHDITAVVGANESGKSHLLDAITILLEGEGLSQNDFCRYSALFSVEKGQRRFPEIGGVFQLTGAEKAALDDLGVPVLANSDLLMLRPEPDVIEVINSDDQRVRLEAEAAAGLQALLPHAFLLKTQVELPDSVSIGALAQAGTQMVSRQRRHELWRFLRTIGAEAQLAAKAGALFALLGDIESHEGEDQKLGRLLLTKVARIEASAFRDLQDAIEQEREGLVNALIQEMNKSLARHLNISKWWSQDEDFQLRVSPREHELVFTIRDRTGTDYSFSERSRGLTYFLSYYIQLRSHDRSVDRPEVLVMDEPDAYLSALGQQDLLRVLEEYAHPEDEDRNDQVVYVTHSPFLINRNAGHRVRVVDKGSRDEGTRLVKDVTQNHYEPLRTSLGAFVAETAFIGGDNLFVEGIADQVLIAGMNARFRRAGVAPSLCLDLNQVTIVPGGSNVPYMLYLARGRDQFKPACAVLLDSDAAGKTARSQILRGGARGRPTVTGDLIVMLGEWSQSGAKAESGVTIEEPEDLVPVEVAVVAARRYAEHLLGATQDECAKLTAKRIRAELTKDNTSMWDAIEAAFEKVFGTGIGKAGFAKEILGYLKDHDHDGEQPAGIDVLDANFKSLIQKLAETLQLARERENDERRDQRVDRIIDEFVGDHPTGAVRDSGTVVLRRIDAAADDSVAGDIIRAVTATLRRDFQLSTDPMEHIADYADFLERLKNIPVTVRLQDQGRLTTEDVRAVT